MVAKKWMSIIDKMIKLRSIVFNFDISLFRINFNRNTNQVKLTKNKFAYLTLQFLIFDESIE